MPNSNEELKQNEIDKYINLLRIKKYGVIELDYQIKTTENKLNEMGVTINDYTYPNDKPITDNILTKTSN